MGRCFICILFYFRVRKYIGWRDPIFLFTKFNFMVVVLSWRCGASSIYVVCGPLWSSWAWNRRLGDQMRRSWQILPHQWSSAVRWFCRGVVGVLSSSPFHWCVRGGWCARHRQVATLGVGILGRLQFASWTMFVFKELVVVGGLLLCVWLCMKLCGTKLVVTGCKLVGWLVFRGVMKKQFVVHAAAWGVCGFCCLCGWIWSVHHEKLIMWCKAMLWFLFIYFI